MSISRRTPCPAKAALSAIIRFGSPWGLGEVRAISLRSHGHSRLRGTTRPSSASHSSRRGWRSWKSWNVPPFPLSAPTRLCFERARASHHSARSFRSEILNAHGCSQLTNSFCYGSPSRGLLSLLLLLRSDVGEAGARAAPAPAPSPLGGRCCHSSLGGAAEPSPRKGGRRHLVEFSK